MNFLADIFTYNSNKVVCGLTKELANIYIYNYFKKNSENTVILTSNLYEANNIYKNLQAYTDDVLFFPMDDFMTSVALAVSPDLRVKRLETIEKLANNSNKKYIIITSLMGYLKYLPNVKEDTTLKICVSKNISREIIIDKLEKFGYRKDSLVTTTGEYAIRGYLIDIFPIGENHPIRIEFFGDEIDCIKVFDENTQLSIMELNEIEIRNFTDITNENPSCLMDYIDHPILFTIDENQIMSEYKHLQTEMFEYRVSKNMPNDYKFMFDLESIKVSNKYKIDILNNYQNSDTINYYSNEITNFNSNMEQLKKFCMKEINSRTVIFVLENEKQVSRIQEIFGRCHLIKDNEPLVGSINYIIGKLNKGFVFENYVVISPYDIENVVKHEIKYKNSIRMGRKIKSFSDLEIGDYIVHELYGIGIYNGLKTLKKGNTVKDYLQLSYQNEDKVYVPIDGINKIYKYASKDTVHPKLDKLNSSSWAKRKLETRNKIRDISGELLELYSKRSQIQCDSYVEYPEELQFAFEFPYTLTEDQEKAIQEIMLDLSKKSPMDRLLCGDVGYGKTEVAFRAMFRAVLNNKQVAYLCPTTVLSKQQYQSAINRFKNFPIRIELLNRYVSATKVKQIYADLEAGKIDIIIGTHKLLNKNLKFKQLGLLIVDEEQRFGVTHKEKIKELKTDINVLTLSATPIPRTLKLAMSGLRGLSILDTPPINRYPIQTYVIEENDLLIRDAIYKELARNGQIFILINEIESMDKLVRKIQKLVPEARIATGHGQMDSTTLNDVMESFINKEYDVLVCTTIIETGIDISNANTIIILNSDRFGLSQLYQIRGRVGRSDKIAYAYLMYKASRVLTETAVKRLDSIKEFTELGSGYKIAMRDLAIRGAGDLLGREQAGFIDSVGIDMYTKMVNEEVLKLQGQEVNIEDEEIKNMKFDVNAYIDNNYVSDENIKIEIHKLINSIKNEKDYINVKNEIEDRFGKISEDIEIYMLEKCTENYFDQMNLKNINTNNKITVVLPEDASKRINGEKLFLQVYNINPKFQLEYKNNKISISLIIVNLEKHYIYYLYDLLKILSEQLK